MTACSIVYQLEDTLSSTELIKLSLFAVAGRCDMSYCLSMEVTNTSFLLVLPEWVRDKTSGPGSLCYNVQHTWVFKSKVKNKFKDEPGLQTNLGVRTQIPSVKVKLPLRLVCPFLLTFLLL